MDRARPAREHDPRLGDALRLISFRLRGYTLAHALTGSESDQAKLRQWMTEGEDLSRFLDEVGLYLKENVTVDFLLNCRPVDYFLSLADTWKSLVPPLAPEQEEGRVAASGVRFRETTEPGRYAIVFEGADVAVLDQVISQFIIEGGPFGATVRLPGNRVMISEPAAKTLRALQEDRRRATNP